MCKIVRYQFACQHGFRQRRSKCGGTKHRRTRSGLTPACKSEAYLSIKLPVTCGPCQHAAFEERWKHKLAAADAFLEKLKENDFPGVYEVTALVEHLGDDFNTASWHTRTLFPHALKEHTVRVERGHFERRSSPLRCAVSPADIPEPPHVVVDSSHPDYQYDGDYVASTDPLHPVDVSWMLQHLSLEEFEQDSSGVGFDAREAENAWAGGWEESQSPSAPWDGSAGTWTPETTDTHTRMQDPEQRPEVRNRLAPANAGVVSSGEKQALVEMVIDAFWSAVNGNDISL